MELPRFVRRMGVLGGIESHPGPGTTVGVLEPFEGVLNAGVGRSGRLPPALEYLTLTDLVARGLNGDRPHGTGPGRPGSARVPAADRSSATLEDDPELKVYQLLQREGEETDDPGRAPGSGFESESQSGSESSSGSDEADYGPTGAADRGQAPSSSQSVRNEDSAGPDRQGEAIRELRQLGSGFEGLGTGSRGHASLRTLDNPRTVLVAGTLPTRRDGSRASEGSDIGGDYGEGLDDPTRRPLDRGESTGGRADAAPPTDLDLTGRRREATTGSETESGTQTVPVDTPVSVTGADTGAFEGDTVPTMETVTAPGIEPGESAAGGTSAFAALSAVRTETPAPGGDTTGSPVPLTVLEGADSSGRSDDSNGRSGDSREDGGRFPGGSDGERGAPRSAGADGTPTTEEGAGTVPAGDGEAGHWQFPQDLSLEGGGPDARFIEELYRELSKKMRIENDRRGF